MQATLPYGISSMFLAAAFSKSSLKRLAPIVLLLLAAVLPASAQTWPPKTVRIIVPFGAGSTPDIEARIVAEGLSKKYPDSAFVVENRPGASGNIGTDAVAKAAPDGATIGISIGGPLAINTLLFSNLPYDPHKDIAPITQLVTQSSVLAVNPELKVNSVGELVALLHSQSGQIQLRLHRQWLVVASDHGGTCHQGRHQTGSRALPRFTAGDHRAHTRRRADGLPAADFSYAAGRGRQSENSRRCRPPSGRLFCRTYRP